jgi:two-component system OmpR family sensor kinase
MPHKPTGGEQPPGERADELLAIVAHELRRPLTALLGALATLQHRGQALSIPQQDELVGMARRQGEQLQRLLEQVLVAGGLDHAHTGLARESLVDVAALAYEAGLAARLANPSRPLIADLAGPLMVRADPLAISRILGNLLDNAATHTPSEAPIRLSAGRDGLHAVLAVQDGGPGIPPGERERVFERYARLDQRTGRPGVRLGLGLYIARRLAHANRGELRATDPTDGPGARLELCLPLATPPTPSTRGPEEPPA